MPKELVDYGLNLESFSRLLADRIDKLDNTMASDNGDNITDMSLDLMSLKYVIWLLLLELDELEGYADIVEIGPQIEVDLFDNKITISK